MALCFFFKADVGILELLTTNMLSQNTSAGPSAGIPKHINLYLRYSIISVEILRAKNSDPKIEASTVFCCLLYQMIGELLTYMMMPECDLIFAMFIAWLASTKALITTYLPSAYGICLGIISLSLALAI